MDTTTEINARLPNGAAEAGHPWASFADPVDASHPWESFADPMSDEPSKWGHAKDLAKSGGIGVVKGTIGLAGLLGELTDMGAKGLEHASNYISDQIGVERYKRPDRKSVFEYIPTPSDIQGAIETQTGKFYEPKTTAGRYAETVGEFLPAALAGPGGVARKVGLQAVLPGVASEGAGQYLEGSPYETPGRIAAGLTAGIGGALLSRPSNAVETLRQRLPEGITQATVDDARSLMVSAKQKGLDLTWPEALSQVSGRPVLSDTQRILESAPTSQTRMQEFYGARPQQFTAAAAHEFDSIAPASNAPSEVGPTVGRVAQQALRESPEGGILADTVFHAGPRVTPEQAGNTMQQELRGVYDRREGMRAALADQDYTAARSTGVPVATGNVDGFIERELQTAKGSTARALEAARATLYRPDGTLDASVAGLHNARSAIADQISEATRAGANNTARELRGTLDRLDDALESVPAYGQARRNFQAASQPMEPFGDARAPGQIIERDQYNQRNVMPAERVPQTVQQGGPSASRDFNSVATPAAREAFEQHIVTQVLDKATRDGADLSADSIRQALRQNEDLLRQHPGVRDRLESVAIAREGLARLESSPIGMLASRDITTKKAVDALFPSNPLPNSAQEVSDAVSQLAQRRPAIAAQLVRTHLESVFNEATRSLQSGPNQFGAAGFAKKLVGNAQQRENMRAAVEALPNGRDIWRGFDNFLEAAEATGTRQAKGSLTAFNDVELKGMAGGGPVGGAVKLGASPGKWWTAVNDRWGQWQLGKNLDGLATIFTDPNSAALLKRIAVMPRGSREAQALAARLTAQNLARPDEKSRDAKR